MTTATVHQALAALAVPDPQHGSWHTGAEAARASLRRALAADNPTTAVTAWLTSPAPYTNRTPRAGYRAIQTDARALLDPAKAKPMATWKIPRYFVDVPELLWRVDQRRNANNLSWADVSRETRIHPSVWQRMREGSPPRSDVLVTLIIWLGVDARTIAARSNDPERPSEAATRPPAPHNPACECQAVPPPKNGPHTPAQTITPANPTERT